MKTKTIYQCEYCLEEYNTAEEAYQCEANCLKLTKEQYAEYLDILNRVKITSSMVSKTRDEETEKLYDEALDDFIEFKEKYGLTDAIARL